MNKIRIIKQLIQKIMNLWEIKIMENKIQIQITIVQMKYNLTEMMKN